MNMGYFYSFQLIAQRGKEEKEWWKRVMYDTFFLHSYKRISMLGMNKSVHTSDDQYTKTLPV